MQTDVTFRGTRPTDALRDYAEDKLEKVTKYLEEPISAHVVLEVVKDRHRAHVTINSHGTICQGEKTTRDLYSAIDGMMDRVEKQLRRHKGRGGRRKELTHHGALEKLASAKPSRNRGTNNRTIADTLMIRSEPLFAKPMSVDEAILQFERLKGHDFLVFRNDQSDEINVLYKRKDGAYGLIDPSL